MATWVVDSDGGCGMGKPEMVIASAPPIGLCAAAMRVSRRFGARFVCDIQDAWPETFERLLPNGLKWIGNLLFLPVRTSARRIYRIADVVTGVSQRYAVLSGRHDFYLAYHGIAAARQESVRGNAPVDGGSLVYIGNLGSGYDLDTVIMSVAVRPNLTLDIAGSGPRESHLRALVVRLGLEDRIRFHGYIGSDALSSLMSRCNVGIIPMRDDSWVGLPYKLGDYLNAGLHVLSSLHGECGALLERTGAGRTYSWGSTDSFLSAFDALPDDLVVIPDDLRAEWIYPRYRKRVCAR